MTNGSVERSAQARETAAANVSQFKERVLTFQMTSMEAAKLVDDESLDVGFVDARHQYPPVCKDMAAWYPKIRPGGIFCGHDYGGTWKGVTRAVNEFGKEHGYEIGIKPGHVWWIKKRMTISIPGSSSSSSSQSSSSNSMGLSLDTGGFSARKARRRGRRLDEDFCKLIEATIPKGCFVLDLGAGAYGAYVHWMRENDWHETCGIDASPNSLGLSDGVVQVEEIIHPIPYRFLYGKKPDWIIFSEVGEHIPGEFSDQVFANLAAAKRGVLLSWAIPGQRGTGHINCRTPEWVACRMGAAGFQLDEEKTLELRAMTSKGWKRKVMVFRR